MSVRKWASVLTLFVVLISSGGNVFAETTSILNLVMQSRFNIVTTEPEDKISDMLTMLNAKIENYYTISAYKNRAIQLNRSDMLLIIDRQKAGSNLLLLERQMGITANEIGQNTVLVSVFRRPASTEGFRILITAPDEHSLYRELDKLFVLPEFANRVESTGFSIVRKYDVVNMLILSDLDQKVAADWVISISKPGGDVYDYGYVDAQKYKPDTETYPAYVIALNSALSATDAVKKLLSKDFIEWIEGSGRQNQWAAANFTADLDGKKVKVYAFAAPGTRHLAQLLASCDTLSDVPDKLFIGSFRDYSQLKSIGISIYRQDSSDAVLASALKPFNDQLTSAFKAMNTGASLEQMQSAEMLQALETDALSKVNAEVNGIAVLEITDYQGPSAPAISDFSLPKPTPPAALSKSDKNNAAKLKAYQTAQKAYSKKLEDWEAKRIIHQQHLANVSKVWVTQENTMGDCSISGIFRLYSSSGGGRTLLLELPFYGTANKLNVNKPSISQAFTLACKDLTAKLLKEGVFPADVAVKTDAVSKD